MKKTLKKVFLAGLPLNILSLKSYADLGSKIVRGYKKNLYTPYLDYFNYLKTLSLKERLKSLTIYISLFIVIFGIGFAVISTTRPPKTETNYSILDQQKGELQQDFNGVGFDKIDMNDKNQQSQYIALKLWINFNGIKALLILVDKPSVLLTYTPNITGVGKEFTTDPSWYQKINFKEVFKNSVSGVVESLLFFSWLLFSFFFVLKALWLFNPLSNEKDKDPKELVVRIIITLMMYALYPYFISTLIETVNAISSLVFKASKERTVATEFMSLLDAVIDLYTRKVDLKEGDLLGNAIKILKFMFDTTTDFVSNLNPIKWVNNEVTVQAITIPLVIASIGLILLTIQGFVKVMTVTVLFALYPLIVPFHLFEDNDITENYWKELIGTLLQQPIFVIMLSISMGLFSELLKARAYDEPVGLFIYAIMIMVLFGFMNTAPIFALRIYGNIFSGLHDRQITSGVGASLTAPIRGAVNIGSSLMGSAISGAGQKFGSDSVSNSPLPDFSTKSFDVNNAMTGDKSTASNNISQEIKKPHKVDFDNKQLSNPVKSIQGKTFSNNGYNVTPHNPDIGTIAVEGKYFASDNSNGFTSLYNSENDANSDQAKNIYELEKSFNLQDTTNYKGTENYGSINNSQPLKDNVINSKAYEHLTNHQEYNQNNGVDGLTTTVYPRQAFESYGSVKNIPKDYPRINKSIVYKDSISSKNNNNQF
jgi:hypothetical protein